MLPKEFRDIDPQRAERIGIEPVGLPLGGAEKVADGGATEAVEKAEDAALLNDERAAPVEDRLGAGVVANRDPHRNACSLKRTPERRLEQVADRRRQMPFRLL